MKTLKQILTYIMWIAVSLLLGISYMRIVLGPNEVSSKGLSYLLHVFFDFGLFYVGLIIGSIIALLFILLDVFYLKKKLTNTIKSTITRFLLLLVIAVIIGITHYMLEKVIDVI